MKRRKVEVRAIFLAIHRLASRRECRACLRPAAAYIIIAMYIAFGSIGGAAGGAGTPARVASRHHRHHKRIEHRTRRKLGRSRGAWRAWSTAPVGPQQVKQLPTSLFVTKILAWSVRALAMNTGQVSPPRTLGTPCSSVYATCSVDGL